MFAAALPFPAMSAAFVQAFPGAEVPGDVAGLRHKVDGAMQAAPSDAVQTLARLLANTDQATVAQWVDFCRDGKGSKSLFVPRSGEPVAGATTRQFGLTTRSDLAQKHVRHPVLARAMTQIIGRLDFAKTGKAPAGFNNLALIDSGGRASIAVQHIANALNDAGYVRSSGAYGQMFGTSIGSLQSIFDQMRAYGPAVCQIDARALVEDAPNCAAGSSAADIANLVFSFMNEHPEHHIIVTGSSHYVRAAMEAIPGLTRRIADTVDLKPAYKEAFAHINHEGLRSLAMQDAGAHVLDSASPSRVSVALEGDAHTAQRLANAYAHAMCAVDITRVINTRTLRGHDDATGLTQMLRRCGEEGGAVLVAPASNFLAASRRSEDELTALRQALVHGLSQGGARIFVHGSRAELDELKASHQGIREYLATTYVV